MMFKGCIKEVDYVNDIGEMKKIVIYPPNDGKYPFDLWSNRTGDWCGSGTKTREEINEFFKHYNVNDSM